MRRVPARLALVALLVAACAGARATPVPTPDPTPEPAPTDESLPGGLACTVIPAQLPPGGGTVQIAADESGLWVGAERWYDIAGPYLTAQTNVHRTDGAVGTRPEFAAIVPPKIPTDVTFTLSMRDYDGDPAEPPVGHHSESTTCVLTQAVAIPGS